MYDMPYLELNCKSYTWKSDEMLIANKIWGQ